jgi:hypothetical protein
VKILVLFPLRHIHGLLPGAICFAKRAEPFRSHEFRAGFLFDSVLMGDINYFAAPLT